MDDDARKAAAVDKFLWLQQKRSGGTPDVALLLSGLCTGPSCILDGVVKATPVNGGSSIVLTVMKPDRRRRPEERDTTEFHLDPESVLILAFHGLAGFRAGIKTSESSLYGEVYYYLLLGGCGRSVRFHRFIVNASSSRLAKVNSTDHRDLRRESLGLTQTAISARRVYGVQLGGIYLRRADFIKIAAAAYRNTLFEQMVPSADFRTALRNAYRLLDKVPLGSPDNVRPPVW